MRKVPTLAAVAMVLIIGLVPLRAVAADGQAPTPTAGRAIPVDEGVVQGRVVETGSSRPVAGAQVQALSASGTFETTTDAEGRYEIAGMVPDSYTVAARANGFVDGYYGQNAGASLGLGAPVVVRGGQATVGIDLSLQIAGRISGRILSPKGEGLAGVEIELMPRTPSPEAGRGVVGWAQTGDDGSYALVDVAPGDYVVRAYLRSDGVRAPDVGPLVYTSTFYPGVPDRDLAQPLRVYAGQESFDVDFPLTATHLYTVSGTVVDEEGDSLDGLTVRLVSMDPGGSPREGRTAAVDAHGRFEFRDVAPGQYMARIASQQPFISPGPPMPGALGRLTAFSRTLIVPEGDLIGIDLRLSAGARVVGRVMTDAGSTGTLDRGGVRLSLLRRGEGEGPASFTNVIGVSGSLAGLLNDLPVASGTVYFDVSSPPGWMVKAVRLDGAEIDDGPVELAAGRREVDVVLTDRVSGVSGVVVDGDGRSLPNHAVIVFPSDPARWVFSLRAIREERTDSDGRFSIDGLPPGSYQAVAVPAFRHGAAYDAAILERLKGPSQTIRVTDGQQLTLSIRASALPDGLQP